MALDPELVFLMTGWRRLAIVLVLFLSGGCTQLFFQPMKEQVLDPHQFGWDYRDVEFAASDGVRLHGWYFPASGQQVGSILFLHGNAENISTHFTSVAWLARSGYAVLAIDYRGYGRSQGSPDLDGVHLDIAAGLDALLGMPGTDPDRVVVLGQSLGGALALTAMAQSPFRDRLRAVIVEGAFSGYRAIVREKLAQLWLTWPLQWPLGLTIDDRYDPTAAAAALKGVPLLIIQGEDDLIVPPHHGEILYEAAHQPKDIWMLAGTGHIQAFADPANRQRLLSYLKSRLASPALLPAGRHQRIGMVPSQPLPLPLPGLVEPPLP